MTMIVRKIDPKLGTRQHTVVGENGRKTTYIHYLDGMEVWELRPDQWEGWKLVRLFHGETEVR